MKSSSLGGAGNLPGEKPGSVLIRRSAAMLWYSSVKWKYELLAASEVTTPRPTVISSGDIFGLYSHSLKAPLEDHIIVYPKIFPVATWSFLPSSPWGNPEANTRFSGPTRTIGVRDYRHGAASGTSTGRQAHAFRPCRSRFLNRPRSFKVAVFFRSQFHPQRFLNEDEFELGISGSASLAHHVIEEGSPAGLFVNTQTVDSVRRMSVVPSGSRGS